MRILLTAFSLTTAMVAQGAVPPFTLAKLNPHPGLSTAAVLGSDVQQVHMVHVAGDPPNVRLCGLTVSNLPRANGGAGGTDLLTGKYDVLTDTFTPDNLAAALNATGTEFGITFHPNGLYCAFDRLPGPPVLAQRASLTSAWTIVALISGLPSQTYYDPVLAEYKGKTQLIHVYASSIAMTAIDLRTGVLSGTTQVIAQSSVGGTANSPTPVVDSKGEIIGLSHHDLSSSDNDHYMSLDLNPATPAILFNDTSTWTNNGTFVGGRFFDAEYTPSPYHVLSIDSYWFTGGRAGLGQGMEVRAFVPPTTANEVWISFMLASVGFNATPVSVAGLNGQLGLNSSVLIAITFPTHNNLDGESLLTITVPTTPTLAGATIPCQLLTLRLSTGALTFGNTAVLTID